MALFAAIPEPVEPWRPPRERPRPPYGWIALVAAATLIGVLLLVALLSLASGVSDNARAGNVAQTYAQARLSHDYGTEYDAASPACKGGAAVKDRAAWIAAQRQADLQAQAKAAPSNATYTVQSVTGSENSRSVVVRARNPNAMPLAPNGVTQDFAVGMRKVGGQWGAASWSVPGVPPDYDCNVL